MMEGSVVTVQNKGSTAAEAPPMGGQGRSRNGQRNPAFSTMRESSSTFRCSTYLTTSAQPGPNHLTLTRRTFCLFSVEHLSVSMSFNVVLLDLTGVQVSRL